MNLVIDIGNSFTKIAVFKQDQLLRIEQYENADIGVINNFLADYQVNKAIISSVKKEKAAWQRMLEEKMQLIDFNRGMTKGIVNHYRTPGTLGLDRLAAVIGARYLYPAKNCLIIDGGTAITYDFVDAEGNYFGGSISPGLNMRYKALNNYTEGLPLVAADVKFGLGYGNDTEAAIRSGVQNGVKYEFKRFYRKLQK